MTKAILHWQLFVRTKTSVQTTNSLVNYVKLARVSLSIAPLSILTIPHNKGAVKPAPRFGTPATEKQRAISLIKSTSHYLLSLANTHGHWKSLFWHCIHIHDTSILDRQESEQSRNTEEQLNRDNTASYRLMNQHFSQYSFFTHFWVFWALPSIYIVLISIHRRPFMLFCFCWKTKSAITLGPLNRLTSKFHTR